MRRMSLSGMWKRSVDGQVIDQVAVPGCYRPMGECDLSFEFDRPWGVEDDERLFLVTEGVLASAEFAINGQVVGKAGPWARYRFELPAELLADRNQITARVRDTLETFGPPSGRRFDGGLARKIWLEKRLACFVSDFHSRAMLNEDCTRAECTVAVEFDGEDAGEAHVVLAERETDEVVARGTATANKPARFVVESPKLWSASSPRLYRLTVTLPGPDTLGELVGFRRIEIRGRDFYLNNERLVLKGVCRHEFTSASGYSPPEEEVRRELGMIKEAGFNYVRLVHSPQGPEVCRIAAELGLLVSEEPGTCFHDLSDPAIYGPAFECLMRTVKRDRNVPSIFAWLIYNECNPNAEYAAQAAAKVRELDPDARLSFADCSSKNDAIKAMVQAGNLSYYGINVYAVLPKTYVDRMQVLADRPLVFTEWGGFLAVGNPRATRTLCQTFAAHSRVGAEPRIAGCSFWAWADYEERSRPEPAAIDGWTVEGLTDEQGRPRPELATLSKMCREMDEAPAARKAEVEVLAKAKRRDEAWEVVDLSGVAGDQRGMEKVIDERRHAQGGARPKLGRLRVDGIEFVCADEGAASGVASGAASGGTCGDSSGGGHPLLLSKDRPEITIPVEQEVRGIAVLGHVAFAGGYPSSSLQTVWSEDVAEPARKVGDPASQYELVFADGAETIRLRHGLEILRANDICRWWLSAPRGPYTKPAVRVVVHPSFEILRVDLWERAWDRGRYLKALRWKLVDEQSVQAMWGMSVLLA